MIPVKEKNVQSNIFYKGPNVSPAANFLGHAGRKFKVRVSSSCKGPPPDSILILSSFLFSFFGLSNLSQFLSFIHPFLYLFMEFLIPLLIDCTKVKYDVRYTVM